jgi:hypothetical protein
MNKFPSLHEIGGNKYNVINTGRYWNQEKYLVTPFFVDQLSLNLTSFRQADIAQLIRRLL